jgi:DNA gyrase subunit A
MVNKSALIERIAELSREGGLEGISDLRDESDRQGMRIVIELGKTAVMEKVLKDIFKKTPLQITYGINLLALVDGEPRLLSLKQALRVYLVHRLEVVKRRSEYDLRKAEERLHILEGLRIALKNLDDVIAIIRGSADSDQAKIKLIRRFKLSDIQAQAILDLPLKRLASLERKKIEQEYKELLDLVKTLQGLLKSEAKRRIVVENELNDIRAKYADRRKTQIVRLKQGKALVDTAVLKDVTPLEKVWITLSKENRLMKYREANPPRMGGKDAPKIIFTADSHQTLYLVNSNGKCAAINMHSILFSDEAPNGSELSKVSAFREDETVITAFCVSNDMRKNKELTIVTVTTQGLIKQSLVSELPGPTAELFTLVKVNEGDEFLTSSFIMGDPEIFILTKEGMGIRFSSQEVRTMGLFAAGVNALKLASGDQVVGMTLLNGKNELLLVAKDGTAWRTEEGAFPTQGRYGAGVIAAKLMSGNKLIGLAYGKKNQQLNLHLHKAAAKTIRIDQIPLGKRATGGKKLVEVKSGDSIIAVVTCEDYLDASIMQPVRARKKRAK